MKLPNFIFSKLKTHNTSLGDNPAFPPERDYPFDYKILKLSMNKAVQNLKSDNELKDLTPVELKNKLSKLTKECIELEHSVKNNLMSICKNIVIKLFNIPEDTIELECELVDRIKPYHEFRLLPEESDSDNFNFNDMEDYNNSLNTILKRRLINSFIQGAAYIYSSEDVYKSRVFNINPQLVKLYRQITAINNFLLFYEEEHITDTKPRQGAYVEVELGRQNEKTIIKSQGLLFPYLLTETIRGLFELFASHGLPSDNEKAQYIINKADFLIAEPWDLRFGMSLWEMIVPDETQTKYIPYYFTSICKLPVSEFNDLMQEFFMRTNSGENAKRQLMNKSEKLCKLNSLSQMMALKNANKDLINDEFVSF